MAMMGLGRDVLQWGTGQSPGKVPGMKCTEAEAVEAF